MLPAEKNALGKQRLFSFFVFLITVIAVSFPLFSGSLTSGHDLEFHFLRFAGVKNGLLNGDFPVRIYYSFYSGYGYGSAFFYPDLFFYPFAGLSALGVGEIIAFNLFLLAANIATYLVAAYSFRGLFNSKIASVIGAVLYTAAPYHVHLLYTRKAVGEIVAYILIPLLAYALYNLLRENFSKPYLLVICMTVLIYSHLISAVLCAGICLIACLFGIRSFIRNPKLIRKLGLCALVCILLTLAFFIPMFEQLSHAKYLLSDAENYRPVDHTVSLKEMFFGKEEKGFGFTLIPFLLIRLLFLKDKKEKPLLTVIDFSALLGILCLFISGSLFPWRYMPAFTEILQFPWRVYTYAVFFFTISICGLMMLIEKSEKFRAFSGYAMTGMVILQIFACAVLVLNTVFFSTINAPWKSGERNIYADNGNEYLDSDMDPLSIQELTSDVNARADDGTILPSGRGAGILWVELTRKSDFVRVPLLYYYGYTASYAAPNQDEIRLPISRGKETQVAQVDTSLIEAGGQIKVTYRQTSLQRLSFYFSLSAAVLLIAFQVLTFFRKRKTSRAGLPDPQ